MIRFSFEICADVTNILIREYIMPKGKKMYPNIINECSLRSLTARDTSSLILSYLGIISSIAAPRRLFSA